MWIQFRPDRIAATVAVATPYSVAMAAYIIPIERSACISRTCSAVSFALGACSPCFIALGSRFFPRRMSESLWCKSGFSYAAVTAAFIFAFVASDATRPLRTALSFARCSGDCFRPLMDALIFAFDSGVCLRPVMVARFFRISGVDDITVNLSEISFRVSSRRRAVRICSACSGGSLTPRQRMFSPFGARVFSAIMVADSRVIAVFLSTHAAITLSTNRSGGPSRIVSYSTKSLFFLSVVMLLLWRDQRCFTS